jgi:hypothetical protein
MLSEVEHGSCLGSLLDHTFVFNSFFDRALKQSDQKMKTGRQVVGTNFCGEEFCVEDAA